MSSLSFCSCEAYKIFDQIVSSEPLTAGFLPMISCQSFFLALASLVFCTGCARCSLVLTPAGPLPADCVHGVAHGSQITHDRQSGETRVLPPSGAGYVITPHPRCHIGKAGTEAPGALQDGGAAGFKGGWQAYTRQEIPGWSSFSGNWNVPSAPASYSTQTLFLFIGAQNIDWIPPA